jgi:hypothetical protein
VTKKKGFVALTPVGNLTKLERLKLSKVTCQLLNAPGYCRLTEPRHLVERYLIDRHLADTVGQMLIGTQASSYSVYIDQPKYMLAKSMSAKSLSAKSLLAKGL